MLKNWKKRAVVYNNQAYSFTELLQYSSAYAHRFSIEGSPKKVALYADNSPEWIFAFYGAIRSGAVVVPIDILSTPKEIAYILDDCQPDIVFTTSAKVATLKEAFEKQNNAHSVVVTPEEVDVSAVHDMPVTEIPIGDKEATKLIIYTSGTTGSPKGVMLSGKNMMYNIDAVSKSVPIFKKERNVMILLPLHHAFPLMGSMIAPLHVGATVYIAESMTAESVLNTLQKGKIGIIIGVPRLYDMLAKGVMTKISSNKVLKMVYLVAKMLRSDRLSKIIFRSVHQKFGGYIDYLVSGGAALSDATAEVFKTLGFYVLEGYGMTETAPMIAFTRPGERKIGYVGKPLPGIEVKIDEAGEICVRGDNVMQGYYHREQETAAILRDGWLHTGDRGTLGKHGLKITGRLKEIIVTPNGKNINPEEVEREMLLFSPIFKEVGIFMNNDLLQVVIRPEMSELRDKYIENMEKVIKGVVNDFNQTLPSYKRLKQIHIVSAELPKTRLGKIQHFKLESLIQNPERKEPEKEDAKSKVYEALKQYIESETGKVVHAQDHFEIDLAMDSLSRVALVAFVQSAFGVNLGEEQLDQLNTLQSLSEYIEEKHQSQQQLRKNTSWKHILLDKLPDIKLSKPGFIHFMSSVICDFLVRILYRCKAKGQINIPNEPCIIVANHRSALDGVFIKSQMKHQQARRTYFFAKAKHWKSSFAQFMAEKNNVILMDINKNLTSSLQQMSAALKKGKNVLIFPEGTRSKNNRLNEFKETFAILSRTLNVPVVPVAIEGSERAVYKGMLFPRLRTRIHVNFMHPIYPNLKKSPKVLKDRVARLFADVLEKGRF